MLSRASLAVFLVILFAATPARAMDILLFARMNLDDQSDYVANLIVGAAKILRAEGHPDQAQRVIALFKDKSPNGGVHNLAQNLKDYQALNLHNQDNPNSRAPVYDVEAAMSLTLQRAGINVPARQLEGINRYFSPFYPMH